MTAAAWEAFSAAREEHRAAVARIAESLPGLRALQQRLVDEREGGSFPVDTPVVHNRALDEVAPSDEIKIILVADNPGRREQAAENRRYLVGPSGKLADGFFRAHPELGVDFRKNVVILNKTPIHTPRTAELRELARLGGPELSRAAADSQIAMARLVSRFHAALSLGGNGVPGLWIIGYSELGAGKLFEPFSRELTRAYGVGGPDPSPTAADPRFREAVLLFRHFSMNQFSVDLRARALDGEALPDALRRVGTGYRARVLGW